MEFQTWVPWGPKAQRFINLSMVIQIGSICIGRADQTHLSWLLSFLFFLFLKGCILKKIFLFILFIWLHWVLVATCGIFYCGMWDLVLWSGIEPGLPSSPGKSPDSPFNSPLSYFKCDYLQDYWIIKSLCFICGEGQEFGPPRKINFSSNLFCVFLKCQLWGYRKPWWVN